MHNQHQAALWLWLPHPWQPAELPVQSQPVPPALHVLPGHVPTTFPPRAPGTLERRPGRQPSPAPAAPQCSVCVLSPLHTERFAWKTGEKLPLKGLLCSLLGVGREKVFLRLFEPFWLALHPQGATAKTHPVDSELSEPAQPSHGSQHLPAFGFPSSHTSQKLAFFFLFHVPLRVEM